MKGISIQILHPMKHGAINRTYLSIEVHAREGQLHIYWKPYAYGCLPSKKVFVVRENLVSVLNNPELGHW